MVGRKGPSYREAGMNTIDKTHLVDGKYGICDLVDLAELRRIFERFAEATGFTIGFLDHPGLNILIATGWRDICTKFHRACPISIANCTKSNRHLLDSLDEPGKLVVEQCENGLVDCAFPIIVKGKHIASLATGQLLIEKPDLERFRRQAKLFGLDEHEYLRALAEIPVIPEEKLRSVTMFLGEMALMLSQLGYARLAIKEDAERLENEISIRKMTEKALAEEKERLLVTLRSIGDGVITTDTRGQIVLMNKVAEDLTGWPLAESIDRPLSDVFNIINEKTRERCESPVEKVLHSGQIVGLANHTALVCRDGRERLIADSGAAIRDQSGNIIGVVLVFRDVTDRRKAEEALQNAQKLQSLGVLAGGIAHDFNNYLGGILGHADLALDSAKAGDPAEAANALAQVSSIVGKARNLTQRLLTFARGEMPILKPGSVTEVVREIAAFSTSGSDVALEFHANPILPACSFDANQIAQVIQNLVLNAKQAMPRGGGVRVSVEAAVMEESHPTVPPGSYVRISVRDTGEGIPAEIMPRIFDPFFTTKSAGNGLGLTICYSIVKKHNGYIETTSRPGKGSEFIVYLPAVAQTQTADRQPKPEHMHRGRGTALVMDDQEFIRTVTSSMLQRMGYDTTTASDGTEALKILSEKPFQLVILDLTVPGGMGGIETAREIRRQHAADMIVLAMTGYSEAHVMTDPRDCGFDASIAKPFTMADLASLLNKVVRRNSNTSD
jgi:PAS domain S-box-containing protein